ncbi:PRPF6 Pre-mRNA-processing factor 6 [Candida maltosa Xu316]
MYAAPDTLISGNTAGNGTTNFQSLSESRDKFLSSQLDSLLPTTQTKTDEKLTESILNQSGTEQDLKFADLQKSRIILSSLRKTEPHKASSWIQSARLEEQNKNYKLAKSYILEGCKKCPRNDDIWLENIRLNESDLKMCKQLINTALGYVSKSEKLWIKAVDLEHENNNKRKVLMKALENLPTNNKLWKLLIDLEDNQETVKKLLTKAVDLCPLDWDFWSGLINMSNYADSKTLLNQARKKLSGDSRVWITACKLEERESSIELTKLTKLMDKAMKENTTTTKEEWYEFAIEAEREDFTNTAKAIVLSYLNFNNNSVTDTELLEDVDKLFSNGNIVVGRSILDHIINTHPTDISYWSKLINSIKHFKNLEITYSYYAKAIELNPQTPLFYLMYAKDKWQISNDIPGARTILDDAEAAIPKDLSIKFAKIKLETKSGDISNAETYIKSILDKSPLESEKFWYKYVHILRCQENDKSLETSQKALELFPKSWKLHLQNIQILLGLGKLADAREAARKSTTECPNAPELWIILSQIDEQLGVVTAARSVLDKAILVNPDSPVLWSQKISFEKKYDLPAARNLANRALKKFPNYPKLWIDYLWLLPKMSQRKTAFLDALKATDNSSLILSAIGMFFWIDGKYSKSKNWFERSIQSDNTNGDAWGWMYNYWKKFGGNDEQEKFLHEYEEAYDNLNKGETFSMIKKDIHNYNKSAKEILELTSIKLINITV